MVNSSTSQYEALLGGGYLFRNVQGKTLEERYKPFNNWVDLLKLHGFWPFSRILTKRLGTEITVKGTWVDSDRELLNFGSQDYLGLSNDQRILDHAIEIIREYGINSGGSPVLGGRNTLTQQLEHRLADILEVEQVQLFPSGWCSAFAGLAGLASHRDYIIMDMLMHNSSDVGAKFATEYVYKFKHNSLEDLEKKLIFCRGKSETAGIFVAVETLYSMNSDSPDMLAMYELCKKYDAILYIDATNDLALVDENGRGLLNTIPVKGSNNIVIAGSFSKALGITGGFLGGPRCIKNQIDIFAPCYTFATGLSNLSCALALKALDIAFSQEGAEMRRELRAKSEFLVREFNRHGFVTNGIISPIIPVLIGDSRLSRLLQREAMSLGLLANSVEFPAVPRDKSILRFQMMRKMTYEQLTNAADILHQAIIEAQKILLDLKIDSVDIILE
ncbi:MAG: pyridoxal phosphate-dependent aminotransferase family protein [Chitinophagales bacterium]